MKNKTAFTMLELLIVILIIAIMMALFLPMLDKWREEAIDTEAYRMLGVIARAERAYCVSYGEFTQNIGPTAPESKWRELGIEKPKSKYFNYSVIGAYISTPTNRDYRTFYVYAYYKNAPADYIVLHNEISGPGTRSFIINTRFHPSKVID